VTEATAVLLAAIIAGVVALVSLIVTKEQSVSDFRQQWIDELRKDVADVVGRVSSVHGESIVPGSEGPIWGRVREEWPRFSELIARIRLRLNPDENRPLEGDATRAVLGALTELQSIFESDGPRFHRIPHLTEELVTQTQRVLRENWLRVRGGERVYRITLRLTMLLVAALIVLAVVYGIEKWRSPVGPQTFKIERVFRGVIWRS
jgi:hypothetical protein